MKILSNLTTKAGLFILKRTLVLFALLALLDVTFFEQRWLILAGLTTGCVVSLMRYNATSALYKKILSHEEHMANALKMVFKYIFSQIFTILIMIVSLMQNRWFFMGITAGILLVPLTIFINGITEGLGITKNKFE
jgi:hypothetical protein